MIGMGIVRNGCGQSCDRILKLTVSEGWTDGVNWFFACQYRFTKIKSWSNIFGWAWSMWSQDSKIDCIWDNWIYGINWFFACWYKIRKAKCWWNEFFGGCGKKWSSYFSLWDPNICFIIRVNLWIELIFWMLIVVQ